MQRKAKLFAWSTSILLALMAFLTYVHPPERTYFWDSAFDTGHILIFAVICWVLIHVFDAIVDDIYWILGLSFLTTIGLGFSIEVQHAFSKSRSAEWVDFRNDIVGATITCLITAAFDRRFAPEVRPSVKRLQLLAGAGVVLVYGLIPLALVCREYQLRTALFPDLLRFDADDPSWYSHWYFLQSGDLEIVEPPDGWPARDRPERVASISLYPRQRYPGFVLHEPHRDWRDYTCLEVELYFADPNPPPLVIRVHDWAHNQQHEDRYNETINTVQGYQKVRIPLKEIQQAPPDRELQMDQIMNMTLFAVDLQRPLHFHLGSVRLTCN